jgi:alpha-L-fucosidase
VELTESKEVGSAPLWVDARLGSRKFALQRFHMPMDLPVLKALAFSALFQAFACSNGSAASPLAPAISASGASGVSDDAGGSSNGVGGSSNGVGGSSNGVSGSSGLAALGGSPSAGGTGDSAGGTSLGGAPSAGPPETGGQPAGDFSAGGVSGSSGGGGGLAGALSGGGDGQRIENLKRSFVDLRFGLFLHFGILTYTGSWAQPNLPIAQFNPTQLDASQWASAAKAAGAKFGVLTTRHHDGFALWPSKASTFNVSSTPWKNGQGDVVKEYVDAFRAAGLGPGLYYSIWDATQNNGVNPSPAQIAYIKTQLTELLTNYGKIPLLVFDGWSWKMGHQQVAFAEIHDLVKRLQPDILISDHNGLTSPYDEDLVMYEEPKGTFAPANNQWAAVQGNKINASGGNDWFWAPGIGNLMSVSAIVDGHLNLLNPRHTVFLLNCPPNRSGLIDDAIVARLTEVGTAWKPTLALALPSQGVQNNHPLLVQSATATTGNANSAIDGINDFGSHTMWQSTGPAPQSVTLDLGSVQPDVGFLGIVPPYAGIAPASSGNITTYKIEVSSDAATFTQVAAGGWPADGQLHNATFGPMPARYVRLTATGVDNGMPAATEITVGSQP